MTKLKWYEIRETGNIRYPQCYLTHYNGSKKYTMMVLKWNLVEDEADGWIALLERDTIEEAISAFKNWL